MRSAVAGLGQTAGPGVDEPTPVGYRPGVPVSEHLRRGRLAERTCRIRGALMPAWGRRRGGYSKGWGPAPVSVTQHPGSAAR